MNARLQLGLAVLVLTMGAAADPLFTSGSPAADPFDRVIIANGSVSLGGDAAGTLSNVVFNDDVLTFTYTLALNHTDHTQDGKWSQNYDFYTTILDTSNPTVTDDIFRIQTIEGTGNAIVTFAFGTGVDLTGSTDSGMDSSGTPGFHTLATFAPSPANGGDIGGDFEVFLPEPSLLGWLGVALAGVALGMRKSMTRVSRGIQGVNLMIRALLLGVLFIGVASQAFAGLAGATAPEIDPGQAGSALAFVSGMVLVFRGRRKK